MVCKVLSHPTNLPFKKRPFNQVPEIKIEDARYQEPFYVAMKA